MASGLAHVRVPGCEEFIQARSSVLVRNQGVQEKGYTGTLLDRVSELNIQAPLVVAW